MEAKINQIVPPRGKIFFYSQDHVESIFNGNDELSLKYRAIEDKIKSSSKIENQGEDEDENELSLARARTVACYIIMDLFDAKIAPPHVEVSCYGGFYFMWKFNTLTISPDGSISFVGTDLIITEERWRNIAQKCIVLLKSIL